MDAIYATHSTSNQRQTRAANRARCICSDQFPSPLNDSSPIADLDVHPGFKCKRCPMLTRSDEIVKKHIRTVHDLLRSSIRTAVSLQTWFKNTRAKYWTVIDTTCSSSFLDTFAAHGDPTHAETITWEERISRKEAQCLQNQDHRQFDMQHRSHSLDLAHEMAGTIFGQKPDVNRPYASTRSQRGVYRRRIRYQVETAT